MKFTIFYSWQSDLPNNTNRGFLESVIEKAIKDIVKDYNFEIEPTLDRDTKGAPNISHTILDKIRNCDVFIADISIVTGNKETNQRLSPNPNVLIELGYAVSVFRVGIRSYSYVMKFMERTKISLLTYVSIAEFHIACNLKTKKHLQEKSFQNI